ncbi:MAG: HNH endonuclease, partial [Nanoarchaeota archaeon]|nr:HNH endonuclease [Nanoarchaeota archaeon]
MEKIKKDKEGYLLELTKEGYWKPIHFRIGKEKYKYDKIPEGFVIHHMDEDKTNNKKSNLIIIHKNDHWRLHRWKKILIAERKNYYSKKKLSKEDKVNLKQTIKHIQ